MALINFMGGIGASVDGYNKGAREQRADNKQQDVDAYEGKVRDINTAQLPLAAEAKRLQLENETTDARNAAELKPIQAKTDKAITQGKADMAPGVVDAAKKKQISDANAEVFRASEEVYKGQKNAEVAQEEVRAGIGQRLTDGDTEAAIAMIRNGYASSTIFPSLSGKSPPVSGVVGPAPAGAVDISGKPISGNTLIMKMEDGSTQYIAPSFFDAALQRKKEAARQAAIKITKPGEAGIDMRTGKVAFERDPALPKGWITNDEGDREYIGGGYGAGGSGASGKGGKEAATPLTTAAKLLTDALKDSGEKVANPQSFAKAHAHLENIFKSNPSITPGVAVAVATDAIANPSKVTLQINPKDGSVNQVYTSPDFDGGQPFNLAPNGGSLKEMETRVGKDGMKKAANDLLAGQKSDADRDSLIRAAKDPAYLKALLEHISATSDPAVRKENIEARKNMVGIVRSYYVPTGSPGGTQADATLGDRLNGKNGIGLGSAIPRDAAVKAAQVEQGKAAQATAKGAQAAAATKSKSEASAKAFADVAGLNEEVINQMSPQEAKQMLDKNDAVLSMSQRFALRVKAQPAQTAGRGTTPTTQP